MKKLTLILIATIGNYFISNAQNNCLDFDGENAYIQSDSFLSFSANATYTIECWVKIDAQEDAMFAGFGQTVIGIGMNSSGEFISRSYDGGAYIHNSGYVLQTGVWYHVASVFSGGNSTNYINGIKIGSTSSCPNGASTNYIFIGKGSVSYQVYLNGQVDEVRFWTDVRTETEIRENMFRELTDPTNETNLFVYYKLNETSGTAVYNAQGTSGWDGAFNNGTDSDRQTSPAFSGPKYALDFSLDYVTIGSTFGLGATSVSGECWVYLPSANESGAFVHIGDNDVGYGIGVGETNWDNSGNNLIILYDIVSWYNTSVAIGTGWHHVAYTIDANGSPTVYLDGVSVYSGPADPVDPIAPTGSSSIGSTQTTTRRLSAGIIDEVRIWSDIRAESEIRENMCSTLIGNETDLAAYYNFDNTSGTTLQDISGSSNDGTLTGSTWIASSAFNTWLNTSSTTWSTSVNWSGGGVPTSIDNVGISNYTGGSDPTVASSTVLASNNLVIEDGATLTFSSGQSHTIHGSAFIIGTSHINDGDFLDITGSLYILPYSTLNIKAGGQLTVGTNLDVLATGTLSIKSISSGTGSLIVNGTATADVVQERYIAAATWGTWNDGWHFLSSPVADYAIASNFTTADPNNYDFYAWSEPYNVWVNYKDGTSPTFSEANGGSTTFRLGYGYLAAYAALDTKDFTGTINVSDVAITGLTITGSGNHRSWHLLGNPFNSALTWYTGWTTNGNISTTAKIWNEGNQSYSDIVSGGIIPATNGFMVQAVTSTGTLTIPKAQRVHSSTPFYKNTEYPLIKLKAYNLDIPSAQESQLRFNPKSTTEWDQEFDSDFLAGFAPYFYSIVEGVPQSVNSMPEVTETIMLPFTFIKNEGVNFSIEMYEVENMELDVYLLDKKLNKDHNLTLNPTYYFTAFEDDDHERFVIHFSPVGIEDNPTTSPINIFAANGNVEIRSNGPVDALVNIYNISGQLLASTQINNESSVSVSINNYRGHAVVSVITSTQVINKKVIIW